MSASLWSDTTLLSTVILGRPCRVMTSDTPGPAGSTGKVYRIVP